MDAAVAALIGAGIGAAGAAIGAASSFGAAWLQQRHQTRRERLKLATELAIADWKDFREATVKRGGGALLPIAVYIAYHVEMLEAMDTGTYDAEKIAGLEKRQAELVAALPKRY
jgi:hypothetical protein